ncbi:coq7 protein [Malassezia pachydermatis]|uniref:5-demethoxyubiquinone hydroxylase, mitochondrial n=1 Tax=Malassezia pachydermatis TaxID=77020 RepID=A0A0M8MNW9_9BASI|nr:coq7 protein [Malassezia pachydermatis]KOS16286.1 coq7 protein [Malassezia pachydermatis]
MLWSRSLLTRLGTRAYSTGKLASDAFTKEAAGSRADRLAKATRFLAALEPADRYAVSSMIRVDHAGEIAANTIYEAQADVFGFQGKKATKELILDMWDNERKHLLATSNMLDEYKTRPSALVPLWSLAGRVLGGVTAVLGEKSAMACTEAVETVIGEHYDDQLLHLKQIGEKLAQQYTGKEAEEIKESIALLRDVLIEFRDDELEHLDTAVEHDSQQAPAHALLSAVVEYGCKGAIEIAKRV